MAGGGFKIRGSGRRRLARKLLITQTLMNKRKKKIRLLLVDDHPVVRRGMRSCLEGIRHVEVVDEAVDGKRGPGRR